MIPVIKHRDILDQLDNAKYFITLNRASSYQITMAEKDKNNKTFSIPYGYYKFNPMLFELKNIPATFQYNTPDEFELAGLQGIKCLIYIDI